MGAEVLKCFLKLIQAVPAVQKGSDPRGLDMSQAPPRYDTV